jgi:hypothetical protein
MSDEDARILVLPSRWAARKPLLSLTNQARLGGRIADCSCRGRRTLPISRHKQKLFVALLGSMPNYGSIDAIKPHHAERSICWEEGPE